MSNESVNQASDEFAVIYHSSPKRIINKLNSIHSERFMVPDGMNTGIEYYEHDLIRKTDPNKKACYFEYGNIGFYSLGSEKYLDTIRLLADIIAELQELRKDYDKKLSFNLTDDYAITKDQFIIRMIMYIGSEWKLYKITWIGYDRMYSRNLEKCTSIMFKQIEDGIYYVFFPDYCPADQFEINRMVYETSLSEKGKLEALKEKIAAVKKDI